MGHHPLEQLAIVMRTLTPDSVSWRFLRTPNRDEATLHAATTCYSSYAMDGLVAHRLDENTAGPIMANIGTHLLYQLRDELRRQADAIDDVIQGQQSKLVSYGPLVEPRNTMPTITERCDICNNTGIDYIGRPCRIHGGPSTPYDLINETR